MSGFLGSGKLYFNRVVGGVSQNWLPFGNATKFEIKENAEIKERKSKIKGTYGQVLDSVAIKQPPEVAIALDDLDKDNLALLFLGDVSSVSVTGGSVTSEAQTAKLDKSFELANRKVTSVVVKDVTDTTTYVENTDYEIVNADLGFVKPLSGGSISEDDVLHISYDYATIAGNKISGGTNSSIKVALKLDGENFADQSNVLVDVWEAVLTPQTGVDFLSEDFATLELNGTLNTPSGKSNSYEVQTDLAYS